MAVRHFGNAVKTAPLAHIKNFKSGRQVAVMRSLASDARHKGVASSLASDARHRGIAERTLRLFPTQNQTKKASGATKY
jgi:hypothetical protein